jgi:hypothetical protein
MSKDVIHKNTYHITSTQCKVQHVAVYTMVE